ncbi:MAG: RNA methyltransferase [Prolixibacteraceae bacterium]|nr:RNA methyltransferase [Prolixibacteraceae bacterium]
MDKDKALIEYLSTYVTPERFDLFNKIVDQRTNYIAVVLEDIYQSQNASAVLRTCDCFGVQNVHVIENRNTFDVNPEVSLGSSKWLSIERHNQNENNTIQALSLLKNQGYRIVATTPHQNDVDLNNFDVTKGKCAFVFGTELKGISQKVKDNADEFLKIPMYGFTESFNISVSVAIILHYTTLLLRQRGVDWHLNPADRNALLLRYLMKNIKGSKYIAKTFLEKIAH